MTKVAEIGFDRVGRKRPFQLNVGLKALRYPIPLHGRIYALPDDALKRKLRSKKDMLNILILNGPNLNLLGTRETGVYGQQTFEAYFQSLTGLFPALHLAQYQSNIEGEIVNALQQAGGRYDGVVLNAGGYTHTSVAIRDAIAAIALPVVEVHISNILAREEFRHTSLITGVCIGMVSGFGFDSYRLGIEGLTARLREVR